MHMPNSGEGTNRSNAVVWIDQGKGELPLMHIRNAFAECSIYLYGAHVASFRPRGMDEVLFMSPHSKFVPTVPIRGGIPICFPWFGKHKTQNELPLHGCVRTKIWDVLSNATLDDGSTRVVLGTSFDANTLKVWPHRFSIELAVTVSTSLTMELLVENIDNHLWTFEDAFHNYFTIGNLKECTILGLEACTVIDRTDDDSRSVQKEPLAIEGECVKIFINAPGRSTLIDKALNRRIIVEQRMMRDTVVWNPGYHAGMANLEVLDAWDRYVCVESANCLGNAISLDSDCAHRSVMTISALPFGAIRHEHHHVAAE